MPSLTRLIRRLVPSTVTLSQNPFIMVPLELIDRPFSWIWPEMRKFPPNKMRVRVGVGNRLLFNQCYHLGIGISFWIHALAKGHVNLDSNILDIGCGCGRVAMHLRDFGYAGGQKYTGMYTGIDVDKEMIDWCRAHFPADHFSFVHCDVTSKLYNPTAGGAEFRLPCAA